MMQKIWKNDWNPGKWVLIWEYSVRAFLWIPTWQGLDGFQRFLHYCALDEGSLSIRRVNPLVLWVFSSKEKWCNFFKKATKHWHVGIHWKGLTEYSQMSTHLPGFPYFFRFFHHFVMDKLATSSIRVINPLTLNLLVANLADTKWCRKPVKWLEPWHMGNHLRALQWITTWQGLDGFQKIFVSLCFGRK